MPHGSFAAFKETLARKKARDVKKKSLYDNKYQVPKRPDKKTVFNFPKLSTSELESVKLKIRKRLKKERQKKRILASIILIAIFILALTLLLKF
jgi:hypothetical protein